MRTVVERELELKLVLSPQRRIPVPARLGYVTDDPYAVHVTFHIDSAHPVHWTFARDLLVEGVFRPCGRGDVRVWPAKAEGRGVVLVALSSPDGDALLEAPAATNWTSCSPSEAGEVREAGEDPAVRTACPGSGCPAGRRPA
ncbi:SsgA family sporulation/cell division regulator [Streptomyces coeruleorubidus]|jgi:hypothetical protein